MFLSNPRYYLPSAQDVDFIEDELLSNHSEELTRNYSKYITEIESLNKSIDCLMQEIRLLEKSVHEAGKKMKIREDESHQHHKADLKTRIVSHSKDIDKLKQSLEITEERFKVRK